MELLQGKIALITGASRGIGEGIARRFAAEGATVICSARSVLPGKNHLSGSLSEHVSTIEDSGGKAVAMACDVSSAESRDSLVREVLDRFGHVDILVNNAATATYGTLFEDTTAEQYLNLFEINLRAPFEFIQRLAPGMKQRGQGWILNLTSVTSETPEGPPYDAFNRTGGVVLYGTTKAAIKRLTTGLAAELDGTGVAVNALAPRAVVWTPTVAAMGLEQERAAAGWEEEPVEAMAEAAVALCSGDPRTLTGRCVYSTPFLKEIGRDVRTLDGRRTLNDWIRPN